MKGSALRGDTLFFCGISELTRHSSLYSSFIRFTAFNDSRALQWSDSERGEFLSRVPIIQITTRDDSLNATTFQQNHQPSQSVQQDETDFKRILALTKQWSEKTSGFVYSAANQYTLHCQNNAIIGSQVGGHPPVEIDTRDLSPRLRYGVLVPCSSLL